PQRLLLSSFRPSRSPSSSSSIATVVSEHFHRWFFQPLERQLASLHTPPTCAPVNASCPASRLTTHDSGSVWLARPSPYGSFIRTSTPVYPGAPIHSAALSSDPTGWRGVLEYIPPRMLPLSEPRWPPLAFA